MSESRSRLLVSALAIALAACDRHATDSSGGSPAATASAAAQPSATSPFVPVSSRRSRADDPDASSAVRARLADAARKSDDYAALERDTSVTWTLSDRLGKLALMPDATPHGASVSHDDEASAALTLVTRYRGIFGVVHPAHDIAPARRDQWNAVVLGQVRNGVTVEGGEVVVNFEQGHVHAAVGHFVPGIESVLAKPRLTSADAIAAARKASGFGESAFVTTGPSLVIAPVQGRGYRLVYSVSLASFAARTPAEEEGWNGAIDAETGGTSWDERLRQ